MKHYYILLTSILFTINSQAQQAPFITTWEVNTGSLDITIPTTGTGYNYTIDFGDGTVQNNVTGDATHNYNSPGIYTVSITGDFPRIFFLYSTSVNSQKLLSVEQWGDIQWQSMEHAFRMCVNLVINAIDTPDLTQVMSLKHMFRGAASFNQSIDNWDVSNIIWMDEMFYGASSFNQPLNNWNVSNVTNMRSMFFNAASFNQPLNNWDVSSVTRMSSMFSNASSFNQPLNDWDVSGVIHMASMFQNAISFNQPLNNWDVSNVTGTRYMFWHATNFNQPLDSWNVENVTTMEGMFREAISFNSLIENWNVSSVTNMSSIFSEATSFNQPLNNWNVSSVTNINSMFRGATSFNQPLGNWNVENVTDMGGVFYNATSFNQDLNNWNVSNVTNLGALFFGAVSFNQPLNNWDVSNVTNMGSLFRGASSFNHPLNDWDVNVSSMNLIFQNATSFNQPLNNWDVSNVLSMVSLFQGATSFNQNLNNWDVSSVVHMANMFSGASMFNQDISSWDFNSSVELHDWEINEIHFLSNSNMSVQNYDALLQRFVQLGLEDKKLGAEGLFYCDITSHNSLINNLGWEIHNDSQYAYCGLPGSLITTWEVTSKDLSITIPTTGIGYNYDIDFGDGYAQTGVTGNVTHTYNDMGIYLVVISGDFPRFYFNNSGDKNKLLTIEQWGEISWQSMENAFYGCENLEVTAVDAPYLNQVTDMSAMFKDASSFNQPVNHWDVSNVILMNEIFNGATSFNQDISGWVFEPNVSLEGLLSYSGMDVTNYDAILSGFLNSGLQNKTLGAHGLEFCNEESHDELINNQGWTIEGDYLYANCNMSLNNNHLEKVMIYPVPVNDVLYVSIPEGVEIKRIALYNINGQVVKIIGDSFQEIPVAGLVSGIYFLEIYSDDKNLIKQFIKK